MPITVKSTSLVDKSVKQNRFSRIPCPSTCDHDIWTHQNTSLKGLQGNDSHHIDCSLDSHIDTLYAFAKKVVCYKKSSSASTIHLSTKCKRILFLLRRRTMKMQICSTVNIIMNIYEVQCHMHANEVDLKYIWKCIDCRFEWRSLLKTIDPHIASFGFFRFLINRFELSHTWPQSGWNCFLYFNSPKKILSFIVAQFLL